MLYTTTVKNFSTSVTVGKEQLSLSSSPLCWSQKPPSRENYSLVLKVEALTLPSDPEVGNFGVSGSSALTPFSHRGGIRVFLQGSNEDMCPLEEGTRLT